MPGKDTNERLAASPVSTKKKRRQISLVRLLLPYWKPFTLGILAVLVEALTDLLQPWPLKIVVDLVGSKAMPAWLNAWVSSIFGTDRLALLNFVALSVIAIAVMGAVSSYVESLSMTTVGQWVTHELRGTLYHHIQRLSLSYHDRSQTGDLISRVTSDIDTIQGFITSTLTDIILDILTLVSMLVVMTYIDWRFTVIALSVAPFLFIFVYKYSHRIKKASRAVRKKESEIVSKTQEIFSSIRVVKAFAQENYEKRRFKAVSLETVELALHARALKAGLSPGIRVMTAVGTALMMWYGARLVLEGTLTPGTLVVFLAYLGKLYSPIRRFPGCPTRSRSPLSRSSAFKKSWMSSSRVRRVESLTKRRISKAALNSRT